MESSATGTLQAAFGGVGAVGDMPNTEPAVVTVEQVEGKIARAHRRLAVDFLVYALLVERSRVEPVARVAAGFKLYTSPTTSVEDPMPFPRARDLLHRVAATGAAVTIHAEDPAAFRPELPVTNGYEWNLARPPLAEANALEQLEEVTPWLRLHIAHITTDSALQVVRDRGWSCEVTPHHLLLSSETARDPTRKANPPLRPAETQHALWERFRAGAIPCLATDHAPHSLEDKRRPWAESPSGVPGVETGLPLMLGRVRSGELSLGVVLASACDRPARWMGLPTGRVAPGHRGHLIVVDFKEQQRIQAARLHAPCGWTPFEGFPAVFPAEHYHDGELIVDHGEYVGRLSGKVVRPEYAPGARSLPAPDD